MSLQAKTLCAAGASAHLIRDLVRDQRVVIDAKLSAAPKKWGRNVVAHDLPMTFNIPGLERKDAQRLVYSALVLDLDARGFATMLCPTDTYATLYIAFDVNFGVGEVSAMDALLAARTLPPTRIAEWIAGRGPAGAAGPPIHPTAAPAQSTPPAMQTAERLAASAAAGGGLRAPGYDAPPAPRYVYRDDRIATPRDGLVKKSRHDRSRDPNSDTESVAESVAGSVSGSVSGSVAGAGDAAGPDDPPPPGPGWPERVRRHRHGRTSR